MDLAQRVADELKIGRPQAERALGPLFMSIRMAVDPPLFSKVAAAVPDADAWMRGIQLGGGRTGEILALAGPQALVRQLKQAGFSDEQAKRIGATVGRALGELLEKDAAKQLQERVPLLKG